MGALRVISRDRQATLRDTCFQVTFLPPHLPKPPEVRLNSSPVTELSAGTLCDSASTYRRARAVPRSWLNYFCLVYHYSRGVTEPIILQLQIATISPPRVPILACNASSLFVFSIFKFMINDIRRAKWNRSFYRN